MPRSRRNTSSRNNWPYLLVVSLLLLAVLWQRSGAPDAAVPSPEPSPTRTPSTAGANAVPSTRPSPTAVTLAEVTVVVSATPSGMQTARVVQVIDGDTVRVEINGRRTLVRYIGLDAPEVQSPRQAGEPWGEEATEFNRALVQGREVHLEKDVSETDQYDRLLRYVWVDGTMVNAELIRNGMADGRDYQPDVRYSDWFYDLEGLARQERIGIWSR